MIEDKIFETHLGHIGSRNIYFSAIAELPDFFWIGTDCIKIGIAFSNYINNTKSNQNDYKPNWPCRNINLEDSNKGSKPDIDNNIKDIDCETNKNALDIDKDPSKMEEIDLKDIEFEDNDYEKYLQRQMVDFAKINELYN